MREILRGIKKEKFPFGYKSPTDMGVNMIKKGIVDLGLCEKAALREISRRDDFYLKEYQAGRENFSTIRRMKDILRKAGL